MRLAVIGGVSLVLVLVSVLAINYFRVGSEISVVPNQDTFRITGGYRAWVVPGHIVLNMRRADPHADDRAVMRALVETAANLQDRSFSKVSLAYRGDIAFTIDGAAFSEVGRRASWQGLQAAESALIDAVRRPDGRRLVPEGRAVSSLDRLHATVEFVEGWYAGRARAGS